MLARFKSNINFFILALGLVCYSSAIYLHSTFDKPLTKVSKQESAINFNQDLLRLFSLGNKMLIADLLWVQTLLESDLEHYGKKDLGNWMYLRFFTVAGLDPKFYENYLYGGQYLSIVKDDVEGAAIIYDKGLVHYPDDYDLNYNAGFNYYFEMGNYQRGYDRLLKISDHPRTPIPIKSIINKLKLATGVDIRVVFNLVKESYDRTQEPALKAKLLEDLYAIKAELDLDCLNAGNRICETVDLYSKPYLRNSQGQFIAQKPFNLYRLKKKQGINKSSEN
jgi:tetratricopeptide (TPR) repeat protein